MAIGYKGTCDICRCYKGTICSVQIILKLMIPDLFTYIA